MKDLAFLLCLGAKEAADIRGEVSAALYKKLLREEVTSKRIDAATSPAEVRGEAGVLDGHEGGGGRGLGPCDSKAEESSRG